MLWSSKPTEFLPVPKDTGTSKNPLTGEYFIAETLLAILFSV
jgi:hypothetical protein